MTNHYCKQNCLILKFVLPILLISVLPNTVLAFDLFGFGKDRISIVEFDCQIKWKEDGDGQIIFHVNDKNIAIIVSSDKKIEYSAEHKSFLSRENIKSPHYWGKETPILLNVSDGFVEFIYNSIVRTKDIMDLSETVKYRINRATLELDIVSLFFGERNQGKGSCNVNKIKITVPKRKI